MKYRARRWSQGVVRFSTDECLESKTEKLKPICLPKRKGDYWKDEIRKNAILFIGRVR